MVVNIASLPSTVTEFCGATLIGGAGTACCAGAGASICSVAGPGDWPIIPAGRLSTAPNPNTVIKRFKSLSSIAGHPSGQPCKSPGLGTFSSEGRFCGQTVANGPAGASCQSTVALPFRQGMWSLESLPCSKITKQIFPVQVASDNNEDALNSPRDGSIHALKISGSSSIAFID